MDSGEFIYALRLDCSKAPNLERLRLRWHHKLHWQRHWAKSNTVSSVQNDAVDVAVAGPSTGIKGSITFYSGALSEWRSGVMKHC